MNHRMAAGCSVAHKLLPLYISRKIPKCVFCHVITPLRVQEGLLVSKRDGMFLTWLSCVFVRIRVAGIKGLQGVVRKTVNDELQAIIWEPQHMDKLIPSMLFNMQDRDDLDR